MGTATRDIVTIVQRAIAQSGVDMTGKPEDIPQDVWEAAIKCAETALRNLDGDYGDMTVEITSIARAITAERERCIRIATAAGRTKMPARAGLDGALLEALVRGGTEIASVIVEAIRK